MITAEQIPPEVVEAYMKPVTYPSGAATATIVRIHIAAALSAWPGMVNYRGGWEPVVHNNRKPHLILPLTTGDGH